ncbi:unnamed protein product [Didymodactylos carnosus]|uniref:NAD(P)(+)--arginine ADP-ribosyltransferase n=1 Tax=Didymodactylos carnosus TaxID=1234261 RepID=A0A816DQ67_9BILA|nr:unnamed protein product [Didymodactylos carnosus]CAF1641780.1 unnamed protein product [Didymodactylos carnosus]CAF3855570.1 unnamed protein product [Didymodactylos carnosus]CAF4554649.1 unnamed protein product [Didymodactylos carnosus]
MLVELAVTGLLREGNGEHAEKIKRLLEVKDGSEQEIFGICAQLYSMSSFIYREMNEVMRSDGDEQQTAFVKTKVPTVGPFAYLLWKLLPRRTQTITVYRGVKLSNEQIQQYENSRKAKDWCMFPAFTSTSQNREKAQDFGSEETAQGFRHVLFEIDIHERGADIRNYSDFEHEDEVLLPPMFMFAVISCEEVDNQWIIHLNGY